MPSEVTTELYLFGKYLDCCKVEDLNTKRIFSHLGSLISIFQRIEKNVFFIVSKTYSSMSLVLNSKSFINTHSGISVPCETLLTMSGMVN